MYQIKPTECVRACVASLFEVTLDDVPEFDPATWEEYLRYFLHTRGMTTINMRFPEVPPDARGPLGYTLGAVACVSAAFPDDWKHCVVCLDGYVVWCPVKGPQDGTQRAEEYTVLYPLDPWHMPEWRARP